MRTVESSPPAETKQPRPWPGLWGAVFLAAASAALLAWGCSSPRSAVAEPAPKIPVFMGGPMGLLLTNLSGFSARLVMETPGASNRTAVLSGQLLGREGRLLFAPGSGAKRKSKRGGSFMFMWDVAAKTGWIASEALQGYAPVGSADRFAFVTVNTTPNNGQPEKAPEQPGSEEIDVAAGDGSVTSYRVWRAPEAKGFPRRVGPMTPPVGSTVSFSDFKLEVPSADLFQPPEGFTKYENPDAMMLELISRGGQGVRRAADTEGNDANNPLGRRGGSGGAPGRY